ncbi:CHC2 zinc finger domain-containing protein [Prosthecobacter fluviatilis]|uniref:CHC2 zinc finger domain-containing protein n=1 Tax=Prosthecobacter fluviatilis TaxID=445931 RepID=A0ABW0KR86_9BACT
MHNSSRLDADTLKQRLPDYLFAIGHPPIFHPGGTRLAALCPLHQDTKPSFTAILKRETWQWFCHPCGFGGTVIDLHAARSGRSVKAEFKVICAEIAVLTGLNPATAPASPVHKKPAPKPAKTSQAISAHELERLTAPWRIRLYEDHQMREAFARELQLSPETLRRLTMPCLDALGIVPAGLPLTKADGTQCKLSKSRLVYIGDGGYKIRAPFGPVGPRFWRVGALRRPWRSHWLCRAASTITDVHLVESESTAAALIEAGFNEPFHAGTCVMATSGANGFDPDWVSLFTDLNVHFWPDNDPAGQRFFEETATLLHGTAKRICQHKPDYQTPTA